MVSYYQQCIRLRPLSITKSLNVMERSGLEAGVRSHRHSGNGLQIHWIRLFFIWTSFTDAYSLERKDDDMANELFPQTMTSDSVINPKIGGKLIFCFRKRRSVPLIELRNGFSRFSAFCNIRKLDDILEIYKNFKLREIGSIAA